MEPINRLERIYLSCAKYYTENKIKELSFYEFVNFLTTNNLINPIHIDLDKPKLHPDAKHLFHKITHIELNDNYVNESEKQDLLNSLSYPYPIQPSTFEYYGQYLKSIEDDKRLIQAEKDSKRSLDIAWWSFIIAIGALLLSIVQLTVDYYDIHYGKDFKHETTLIHLDSVQIQQNKEIIQLLKKEKQRDTVIVNIVAPSQR